MILKNIAENIPEHVIFTVIVQTRVGLRSSKVYYSQFASLWNADITPETFQSLSEVFLIASCRSREND